MTTAQPATVDATVFLQVEPKWLQPSRYRNDEAGNPHLDGAKVVAMTQQRPGRQRPGTVLAKITLRIPAGAFLPLSPQAVVVIPESMLVTEPLEVIADDPTDGSEQA